MLSSVSSSHDRVIRRRTARITHSSDADVGSRGTRWRPWPTTRHQSPEMDTEGTGRGMTPPGRPRALSHDARDRAAWRGLRRARGSRRRARRQLAQGSRLRSQCLSLPSASPTPGSTARTPGGDPQAPPGRGHPSGSGGVLRGWTPRRHGGADLRSRVVRARRLCRARLLDHLHGDRDLPTRTSDPPRGGRQPRAATRHVPRRHGDTVGTTVLHLAHR